LNWKVAIILLLLFSATAVTTTMLDLNTPKLSQSQNLETTTTGKNPIPQGEPIDGPGGPH
jgi:hypothetical protein